MSFHRFRFVNPEQLYLLAGFIFYYPVKWILPFLPMVHNVQASVKFIGNQDRTGISIGFSVFGKSIGQVWISDSAFCSDTNLYALMFSLFVHPFFRRHGIASLLIQKAIEKAVENGKSELFLMCRSSNVNAIALYRKMGFKDCRHSDFAESYISEMNLCEFQEGNGYCISIKKE